MKRRIQFLFSTLVFVLAMSAERAHADVVCEHFCQASCEKLREDPMFRDAYQGAFGQDSLLRTTSAVVSSAPTVEVAWEKNRQKCLPAWRYVYDSLPPGIARLVEYVAVIRDSQGTWVHATVANACFRLR
jgi:hypothetical protein